MPEKYALSRAKNPFMEYNGISIVEVSPERSLLKATLSPHSENPYGMIHGGLIYTMIDCCAGITARADDSNYVTQNSYVNFLGNSRDEKEIFAESNVIKRGRTITAVHVIVRTEDGRILADGTVDMFRVGEI